MRTFIRLAMLATTLMGMAACSTTPKILDPLAENVSMVKHGAVVLSIDMENPVAPDWTVWKLGGVFTGTLFNENNSVLQGSYGMGYYPRSGMGLGPGIKKGRKDMPALILIPPGTYHLSGIIGSSRYGILGAGIHFPIDSDTFTVEAGKGLYLGHLSIKVVEKTAPQQIAMDSMVGVFPHYGHTTMMGQVPSRFPKSTPLLTNSSRFEMSIEEIKQDYPYLRDIAFVDLGNIKAKVPLK